MKILFVINALTIGGAQFLLLNIAKEAIKRGYSVEVACFKRGLIGQELAKLGVRVHYLNENFFDIFGFLKLIKIVKNFAPDVIHSHLFRATLWARLAHLFHLKGILVTSVHGIETVGYSKLEQLMSGLSDEIIFSSNYLQSWYNQKIKPLQDRGLCFHPGVAVLPQSNAYKGPVVRPFTIGTLSRLHKIKGVDNILRACALLQDRGVNFVLKIAGEGEAKDSLIALSRELGIEARCQFLGLLPNKAEFLSGLDVFVAASKFEAFGIHICEAMERSLPVLASKVGGIPEIIVQGKTGILFQPEDFNELATLLMACEKDPKGCAQMGKNARNRVAENFNEALFLKAHFDLYETLVQKKQKKLHFVISSNEMGGGERLAIGLINKLMARGYHITTTCAGNPLAAELEELGLKVSKKSLNLWAIPFALQVVQDLLTHRPCYISSHLNRAGLISGHLSKLLGLASIAHVHGLNRIAYYKNSHRLVAVSSAVKRHLCQQGAIENKISVIPNCIDKTPLEPRTFPEKGMVVSITAKLHTNKGHAWALKAIEKNLKHLNIRAIHIIGDGPQKEALKKLVANGPLHKIVQFHGFVQNPDILYPEVDLAILPSAGEGIPLSLLETMRFGIPCIATNVGGIPEVVNHGENGLLIEYKNEKQLIDALKFLSDAEKYEQFSKASVLAFKTLNNYEIMVDCFEKLLH